MYDQVVAYLSSTPKLIKSFPENTWICAVLIIVVDQVSKYLAMHFRLVQINPGVSFGWLAVHQWLLTAVTVLILLGYLVLFAEQIRRKPWVHGLFIGGALSNAADRLMHQGVRDWLPIPGLNLENNLADWAITIAVLTVLVELYLDQHSSTQQPTQRKTQ